MKIKTACVSCFKNLAVESRSRIFQLLQESGKSPVSDVVLKIGLTQPTISYHLKEMKNSGLLKSKKVGRKIYYEISDKCPEDNTRCELK